MHSLLIVSVAFALFIICPRMAGMTNVITRATQTNIVQVAVIGTILSLPLTIAMVLIFRQYGLIAALGFCVLTDVGAALFMKEISLKAGIETFIIALFVIIGVKVASIISGWLT
ncbi:MAG: hypothetical protein KCCBMMGE_02267 [Candidatus Methanoperedenaceae archaeon GB37]|nr:hypothetical protein DMNBHIDG_00075 [Candidatus Methanoperedenaceae archaeon GB37]CAD7783858.1 MAG: hypothetical protein KCCBMMGE_02267 [Candidatus Methanoperedenaceae archaeon GB37]